jgi:hypothetical protein
MVFVASLRLLPPQVDPKHFINATIELLADLTMNHALMTEDPQDRKKLASLPYFWLVRKSVVAGCWINLARFDRECSPFTVERSLRICAGCVIANIAVIGVLPYLGLKGGGMQRQ